MEKKSDPVTLQIAKISDKRETGFEPATSTLARWSSTTELLPRCGIVVPSIGNSYEQNCERRDLNPYAKGTRS